MIICFSVYYIKCLNTIKNIKSKYNNYVLTNCITKLYDSDKNEVGYLYKDTYLQLEKTNIKSKNDIYFKIANSDYYVYYNDISSTDKRKISSNDYYLDLGKSVKTGDITYLYDEDSLKIIINNSFDFNVIMADADYYYVNFFNQTLKLLKNDVEESSISIEGKADYVSIIGYDDTISSDSIKEQFDYLSTNGYYTITMDDLKLWINDYINLKEKAVLITSTYDMSDILSSYNFNVVTSEDSFSDDNSSCSKGDTNFSRYVITSETTMDIFKKILDGEPVSYPKTDNVITSYTHSLPSENDTATSIAVLNYHFFYDPSIGETCPDNNCKKVADFENELNYLKENNYKALTMDEFVKWMYGEIELPARSVLITIDDGAMGTGSHNGNKLIPLLEKYQMHATLFLITGWWSIDNYSSEYLDIESHTYDMHEGNYCENVARGSKLLCSSYEQVLLDLSKSVEITGSKNVFCFPMYVYNDTTMSVLSEIGFKLAFVGGDYKAKRSDNKYKVPRYHIYGTTTLDQFINMIS